MKKHFRFPLAEMTYKGWGISSAEALTLAQTKNLKVVKIVIFDARLAQINDALIQQLEKLCQNSAQFYLTDQGMYIQMMAQGSNKLSGIEYIRTALGIAENELAVFGDDMNDIEMLAAYKYGIAMGNAVDAVKNKAKYATLANDEEGISYAIRHILHLID